MKWFRRFASSAVVTLTLLGAGHLAWARTVKVGIPGHNVTQAAFYVAKERGWYRDEGLDVQLIMMPAPVSNLALIAGNVDFMCDLAANSLPFARNGQIKAYAVMAKHRWFAAPDVPTIEEMGVAGLYMSFWHGVWAPKGTPADVVVKLNDAVVRALADAVVRQRFSDQGHEIPPREQQTPQALHAHHKAEIEKWWPVIKSLNIEVQ